MGRLHPPKRGLRLGGDVRQTDRCGDPLRTTIGMHRFRRCQKNWPFLPLHRVIRFGRQSSRASRTMSVIDQREAQDVRTVGDCAAAAALLQQAVLIIVTDDTSD